MGFYKVKDLVLAYMKHHFHWEVATQEPSYVSSRPLAVAEYDWMIASFVPDSCQNHGARRQFLEGLIK
jgi:hypothetical protein